jgi:hypothetical protein
LWPLVEELLEFRLVFGHGGSWMREGIRYLLGAEVAAYRCLAQ